MSVQSAPKQKTSGKSRSRLVQLLIIVVLLGLVGYGFSRYVLSTTQSSGLPEYVGALKLASYIEGAEASNQISKLHGTSISLENAVIADYRAEYGGEDLKVWAGQAGSQTAALDLIGRMVNGINRGGTPFSNLRQVKAGNLDIWQADGMGGQFFFYRSPEPPDRVVWLTIQSKNTASILESAIKSF